MAIEIMFIDLSELILNNHLLQKISRVISVNFIYEILELYYPSNRSPSINPVIMFKLLLVGKI